MSINSSMMAQAGKMKANTATRIFLFVGGLFLIGLGWYMGISFRSMGSTVYIGGVWWATAGVCLGFRKRYVVAVMAVGIALFLGYWYGFDVLGKFGFGIVLGCIFALCSILFAKKPRPSPPKPPWMAVTLVAILSMGMLSPISIIRLSSAPSTRFEISILDTEPSREAKEVEESDATLVKSEIEISDTEELQYVLEDGSSYSDVLVQDNKTASIADVGMLSPIAAVSAATDESAKLEIHISDTEEIQYLFGDNSSYYDVLIQDNQSLVLYKLEGETALLVINGTEYTLNFEKPASLSTESNPAPLGDEPYFWWDNTYFANVKFNEIKYPHPDRDTYTISLWSDWTRTGRLLQHSQINKDLSGPLAELGPAGIGLALGAVVGSLINVPYGTAIVGVAGLVIGFALTWATNVCLKDEEGCIWWWISKVWLRWLYHAAPLLADLWTSNPPAAVALAMASFTGMGYLRTGTVTFADFISCGSPGDFENPDKPYPLTYKEFYLFKPGTRILYYLASASKEWIEDKIGPAAAWPDRHG